MLVRRGTFGGTVYQPLKGNSLAKPNHQFEKRQRELAKQKKKEEKRLRKLEKIAEDGQAEAGDVEAGDAVAGEAEAVDTPEEAPVEASGDTN